MRNLFFKPYIGSNHNRCLVLLATSPCNHSNDCTYFTDCTINGNTRSYNDKCPYRYESFDSPGELINLEGHVSFVVEQYIRQSYFDYDERRSHTFTKLTNALSLALIDKEPSTEDERRAIWENLICTELCQHFIPSCVNRKGIETLPSDFGITKDFEAIEEIIEEFDIHRILILGKASFDYFEQRVSELKNCELTHGHESGYWHQLAIDSKIIDILYAYHPSSSSFYDGQKSESKLVEWLRQFLNTDVDWNSLRDWTPFSK